MKLKQSPDDFQVEEVTSVTPSAGPFSLYRLTKHGWTTPDALALIRRRWKIHHHRISIGGLKDRHATTTQHVTILHGPQRNFTQEGVSLGYLGQIEHPFTSKDIAANLFRIVLREVDDGAATRAELIGHNGVPNYFDDQRFGSASADGEFIARLMCLNRYEDALRLALTTTYEFDKASAKATKTTLRRLWGKWPECARTLGPVPEQRIARHLAQRPGDFRGAVRWLHPELQGMYLAAYQSFLWNRMLAALLRRTVTCNSALPLKLGEFPTTTDLSDAERDGLANTTLPLPSSRLPWDADASWAELVLEALADQGLTLNQLKMPGLRKPFFSRGERAAWVIPGAFSAQLNADEGTLTLSFSLPRGSYATMVVKHLQ